MIVSVILYSHQRKQAPTCEYETAASGGSGIHIMSRAIGNGTFR